jgi:carbonic anhydrase
MIRVEFLRAICLITVWSLVGSSALAQEAGPAAVALKQLKEGNERFAADRPEKRDIGAARRKELARGQHPRAIVLACADSRVAPELIFDQGLGEMFVLRVAGNVTDADILGSIEYAVAELKTPLVVILGHESCGAVKAALAPEDLKGNLRVLIENVHVGKPAQPGGKVQLAYAIRHNVLYQVETLSRKSPLLKEFIDSQRVGVAAGVYSLETGRIEWLDVGKTRREIRP